MQPSLKADRVWMVFDASPETARRLIDLGRKDARKVLEEAGLGKVSLEHTQVRSSASP